MKNQSVTLKAEKRDVLKKKVKSLRKDGILPANVFGKKIKSQAIMLPMSDFLTAYAKAGETGLIELNIGKEKNPVLVSEVQIHPVTSTPLHVDFRQVDLKEKVVATVAFVIVGESPAEKTGLGNVVQHLSEVEVEALPMDLPDEFQVDSSVLSEVDQAIAIKDLVFDKSKITLKADPEQIIAKVEPLQKEEVVAPPVSEEATAESDSDAEVKPEPDTPEAKEKEGSPKE